MRVPLDAGTHARTHVGVGVHVVHPHLCRTLVLSHALLCPTRDEVDLGFADAVHHAHIYTCTRARAHTHTFYHTTPGRRGSRRCEQRR